MRAVHSLAAELWERTLGEDRAEAIAHAQHLLKLNPNDNQGIRFLVYNWFALAGMWDNLTRLLRRYRDDARTETRYSLALDGFRRHHEGAQTALVEALEINSHVPVFLLGRRAPFSPMTDAVAYRSEAEAQAYAAHAFAVWHSVPGAIEWLATSIRRMPASGS